MNAIKFAFVFSAATFSAAAFAQSAQTPGKTRAEVNHELLIAQHDGQVPHTNAQYPNTAQMVDRNKVKHAVSKHAGETSPKFDQHDGSPLR